MIDSTYRWAIVVALIGALLMVLLPLSYRKGFPKRMVLRQLGGAAVLIGAGLLLARFFSESLLDALLLRAAFGFVVPDTGIHGYGWFLIFGYAILIANLVVLVVGVVMVRAGRVPPWFEQKKNQESRR